MADTIELEARLSAIELAVLTHVLQSGLDNPLFDPRTFALSRRDAWIGVANAICSQCTTEEEDHRFARAYAAALERLGHLLVSLAEPIQEAVDELRSDSSGGEPTA